MSLSWTIYISLCMIQYTEREDEMLKFFCIVGFVLIVAVVADLDEHSKYLGRICEGG